MVASERDPAVYAVLISGWRRDVAEGRVPAELADRLDFVRSEGADLIAGISGPDVGVYLDPMYPGTRASRALPRRELQVLRALLGDESDAAGLLAAARDRAARVVVKRPHRAPPLAEAPSYAVESKLVRFDVYLDPERMGEARP